MPSPSRRARADFGTRRILRYNAVPSRGATDDLRQREDAGWRSAFVIRRGGDARARDGRDNDDRCGDIDELRGRRCRYRRRAGGQQLAFDADIAGGPLERRMLGSLELGADMLERVADAFLLHEQQEERQQARQEAAIHAREINGEYAVWQIGRMADALRIASFPTR